LWLIVCVLCLAGLVSCVVCCVSQTRYQKLLKLLQKVMAEWGGLGFVFSAGLQKSSSCPGCVG